MEFPITDILSIYEYARSAGAEAYQNSASYQNINACITPLNTELQAAFGGIYAFQMFNVIIFDTTVTIKNADKLVNQNGLNFFVEGLSVLIDTPFLSYIKVLAKQKA